MKRKELTQEIKRLKDKRKPKAGDFIEILGDLCLLVNKEKWKYKYCKRNLAVVLLKFSTGDDWFSLAENYQSRFEEGDYNFISRKEALRRLSE